MPNRRNEDDEELLESLADRPKKFYVQPNGQVFSLYLNGDIGEPDKYTDWFQIIRMASKEDTVRIHINSRGGLLFTAIQFRRALAETEASIVVSVEGECASAATMIFMMADKVEISDHSVFLFHNYSGGVVGKGGEMYDQISFDKKWSEKLMRSIYKDFLTDAEISDILINNRDIWMDADEVMARLQKKIKSKSKSK